MPIVAYLILPAAQERGAGPDLTRYVLVCAFLLLLIAGVAYVFRRFFADSLKRRASKRSLQVTDVLPLGGKQRLLVVRCFDRSFLLGVGDKEICSIAELDVEAAAPSETMAEPALPAPESFPDALERVVQAPEAAPPPAREQSRTPHLGRGRGVLA